MKPHDTIKYTEFLAKVNEETAEKCCGLVKKNKIGKTNNGTVPKLYNFHSEQSLSFGKITVATLPLLWYTKEDEESRSLHICTFQLWICEKC